MKLWRVRMPCWPDCPLSSKAEACMSNTLPPESTPESGIVIRGAREHNLRGVDVFIPRNRMTVVTGVSGSGKSSLAFDTLYAEGYRKYMEGLSTKARQLLTQIKRPEVDFIEGLSPVIAIEQRTGQGVNPRSTLASITEVADYARVLWSVAGEAFCPLDGGRIERRSLDDCLTRLSAEPEGSRMQILAPWMRARPAVLREELPALEQKGYTRVRMDGEIVALDQPGIIPTGQREVQVDIVIDRIVWRKDQISRLADSLELAFREGGERAVVLAQESGSEAWQEIRLSQAFACSVCGTVYAPLTPRLFSWNHPDGACPTCHGVGEVPRFLPELAVPDPSLSVRKGAIKPWRIGSKRMIIRRNALLKQLALQLPFDPASPWEKLPEAVRQVILHGSGGQHFDFKLTGGNRRPLSMPFPGVLPDLEETFRTTSSDGLRARLLAYQQRMTCPDCGGSRLSAYSRNVLLAGLGFDRFLGMSVAEAREWADKRLATSAASVAAEAVRGLCTRLRFLGEVGLGYLRLNRAYNSLSGGEAQRARLATQLGMGLVGVTYVLDEPSVGLHPIDNDRLIQTLEGMRDRGNTVVVVEHDEAMIRSADHLIELGPGAGSQGGEVIFCGPPFGMEAEPRSRTGPYLSGSRSVLEGRRVKRPGKAFLRIEGAAGHNLHDLAVDFPLGCLSVVCGVSGSGKSTLVNATLARAVAMRLHRAKEIPAKYTALRGLEHFTSVVRVDQSAIGQSPRSNPATFSGLFGPLRELFARTPLARVRGYKGSRFSFNVSGGRCERCKGDGVIKLDMQFMSDVYVECPSCGGKRYNRETLEVRYRGLNIAEVLELTVGEARELFAKIPAVRAKLDLLDEVGLGYLRLGQSATTLSGGEAQRLKLATELSRRQQGETLYLLDEPTTGLHPEDISRLMDILYRLRDAGNTLIVVEHHPELIAMADWVVELGPGGGDEGGSLLYQGRPEDWAKAEISPTYQSLQPVLAKL